MLKLFDDYCQAVDAIVMLRAFRSGPNAIPHRYQLLEISSEIFVSLANAKVSAFKADGPTIDCAYGGTMWRLVFRSTDPTPRSL